MALPVRADAGGIRFDALVTPRASRARLGPQAGDRIKIAVTAPPVDGEANAAVIECVARALGVPRRAVSVVSGATSRTKVVEVEGGDDDTLAALLADLRGPG
jgi:uncharacterized protein (TIGR00251 family)